MGYNNEAKALGFKGMFICASCLQAKALLQASFLHIFTHSFKQERLIASDDFFHLRIAQSDSDTPRATSGKHIQHAPLRRLGKLPGSLPGDWKCERKHLSKHTRMKSTSL